MDLDLKDRVYIVTDGASALGRQTVRRLLSEGARVVIGTPTSKIAMLSDLVRDEVGTTDADAMATTVAIDNITDPSQVRRTADALFGAAHQAWGRLDAGARLPGPTSAKSRTVGPTRQTGEVSGFRFSGEDFRFPDGVELLSSTGDEAQFSVSLPLEDGHLGRECPACGQHFRIDYDDYDALPEDLALWCVYCGHQEDHSEFTTQQQAEVFGRVAADYGSQLIGQMLDDTFGRMARGSRNDQFVRISYRSTPFYPEPLPQISEENLIRERSCAECRVRYAVFGEHRLCPVCGPLPARTVALEALAADETRINALKSLDADVSAGLREAGVLDRTYADTIENVVGTVEALAEKTFHGRVSNANMLVTGKGKIFQRLDDFADLFRDHVGIDVRTQLGSSWVRLQATWAARHIFTHTDGVVDQKYIDRVPGTTLKVGQRLRATEALARSAIEHARELVEAMTDARS